MTPYLFLETYSGQLEHEGSRPFCPFSYFVITSRSPFTGTLMSPPTRIFTLRYTESSLNEYSHLVMTEQPR